MWRYLNVQIFSDMRKIISLFEGSQVSPACLSGKSNMYLKMNMEHWWNYANGGSRCHRWKPCARATFSTSNQKRLSRDGTPASVVRCRLLPFERQRLKFINIMLKTVLSSQRTNCVFTTNNFRFNIYYSWKYFIFVVRLAINRHILLNRCRVYKCCSRWYI